MAEESMLVVHLVGAPATGKTTLSRRLSDALGWPAFAIHDERQKLLRPGESWPFGRDGMAWQALRGRIIANPEGSIVETMGTSGHEPTLLQRCTVLSVLVVASTATRWRRLTARWKSDPMRGRRSVDQYVRQLLPLTGPPTADLTYDTEADDLSSLVTAVIAWARSHGAVSNRYARAAAGDE